MAEFVQLRKERWTEPLAAVRQLELLDPEEFQSVRNKIDDFEHKIQSPNRKLEDVLGYVQFECELLKKIQLRRKLLNLYDKTDKIDRFIYTEIRAQFGSAELNFKHRPDFWNARLKFTATIVPEQDRESEFSLIFKTALDSCGRKNFEFYKYAVDFHWSLLKVHDIKMKNRKRKMQRKDCSKLMANIRGVIHAGLRNFPHLLEAHVWAIDNELRYLLVLKAEKDAQTEDPKGYITVDVKDETEKAEKLIKVYYSDLSRSQSKNQLTNQSLAKAYFRLYDTIQSYDELPFARGFSTKILRQILKIQPKTPEIFGWLIGKSLEENKLEFCLELVHEALSSEPREKMLETCLNKLDEFIQDLETSPDLLSKVIQFYAELFSRSASEDVAYVRFHISRIKFFKNIPKYITILAANHCVLTENLRSMLEKNPLNKLTRSTVIKFPKHFVIVKERILQLMTKDIFKPSALCKYLGQIDWKTSHDIQESRKFMNFVYYALIQRNVPSEKLSCFLSLKKAPGIKEILNIHLKTMYLQGIALGRKFYSTYRLRTSDWAFACTAVAIETNYCCTNGCYSDILNTAIEDACRLSTVSSTTLIAPWKIAIRSHIRMKNQTGATSLLERALSLTVNNKRAHNDLLLFAKSMKSEG